MSRRLTRLVLTNAIYFKGDWDSQFKKDQTRGEPFTTGSDEKDRGADDAPDRRNSSTSTPENLQVLEMPYAGKELSMVVLLPKKVDGLGELEKSLTADKLAGWLGKAARSRR